jgi:hypothetical protein
MAKLKDLLGAYYSLDSSTRWSVEPSASEYNYYNYDLNKEYCIRIGKTGYPAHEIYYVNAEEALSRVLSKINKSFTRFSVIDETNRTLPDSAEISEEDIKYRFNGKTKKQKQLLIKQKEKESAQNLMKWLKKT